MTLVCDIAETTEHKVGGREMTFWLASTDC